MRVIRWKNSATGVESLNITATGIYFPVGKTDSSFKLKLRMASAGQTAGVDTVRDSSGSRTGYGAMNVSGITETKLGAVVSFATGIIVTAISGTLNAILDDEIAITSWPEVSLGRFPAIEDLVAYCYGSVPPLGLLASVNGVQYTYGAAGWVRQIANYGKNIVAVLGDSIAAATGSHLEQAIFRMGYRLAGKFAVAGSKIEDQSQMIPAIKAAGADTVYIHVGANNWQNTGSQIFSKYVQLFGELYANGLRVVVSSPGPQGNSLQSITHKTVVACYYAAKQFDFQVIDALGIYSTENAGWEVGKSLDDLHPLAATRSEAAALFVSKLQSGTDSVPVIRSRKESLLANSCFALDTNADGLSDSWTKAGAVSGGTLVVAREPDGALGHYKQTIKITNPTIHDDQFVGQTLTPAAGYAPGDVLLASMVYDYSRPADTDPAILDPCVPMIQAQGTLYGFPQIYNGLYGTFSAPVTGAVATRQFVVDSTYTDVRINAGLRAVNTPPAGDYVLKIYRVGLVNLTALGIA